MSLQLVKPDTCPLVLDGLVTYLMHDQPTMCSMCGHRTNWVGENPQFHTCGYCGYQFFVEEDEDFGFIETEDGWISENRLD